MNAGKRLAVGGVIVAATTFYMAYLGASSSWQYYLTVDECVSSASQLLGDGVRVTGKIAHDSLRITADRSEATFVMLGTNSEVQVTCAGPLPDNLAERLEVVVEGRIEEPGKLRGDKVLTRCASKYSSRDHVAATEHFPHR